MVTFRMIADIRMNRKVDVEKDYISPGSYTMIMGGKEVKFDFCENSIGIDKKNGKIIHIECKNPDYSEFEDLENLTEEMLRDISEIEEFFVYTGESNETDLKAVKLLKCQFSFVYNNFEMIDIPKHVCKKAFVTSNC